MLLEGKVALITGSASGIGRSTAQLFAREGARVVVVDVNEHGGLETVTSIKRAGGDALFVHADVGQMEDVRAAVQRALDAYGQLDILHSNAAAYTMGTATEINEAQWDHTLDICLKATWMLAHCAVPTMLKQGSGVIVITGSDHCIQGYAGYSAYQAAKGGLLSLTRSLAADYAPTIRVNAILPGAVITGLWDDVPENRRQRLAQLVPLKRQGRPAEIAQVALFLASDMSSYMTGTYVVVDGGASSIVHMQ